MGIKSTLHFNNGDHHAQNPNAFGEFKEGQKKAVWNALNHSPLFMPSSTERMFGFVSLLQQEIMGNSYAGLPLIQA